MPQEEATASAAKTVDALAAEAKAERDRILEKAVEVLRSRISLVCPMCGKNAGWNAEVSGLLATPIASKSIELGNYFPAIVITCKNCAFMSAHNLKFLGVT